MKLIRSSILFFIFLFDLHGKSKTEIDDILPSNTTFETYLNIESSSIDKILDLQRRNVVNKIKTTEKNFNFLTGQTVFSDQISLGPSKQPINISIYYSTQIHESEIGGTWMVMPHLFLKSERGFRKKKSSISHVCLHDDDGSLLKFESKRVTESSDWKIFKNKCVEGSNSFIDSELESSNHLNYKLLYNQHENKYLLITSNGTRRWYKSIGTSKKSSLTKKYIWYVLEKEKLANGNIIYYDYDEFWRISLIRTLTPNQQKQFSLAQFYYYGNPNTSKNFRVANHINENFYFEFGEFVANGKTKYLLQTIKSPYELDRTFHYTYFNNNEYLNLSRVEYGHYNMLNYQYYQRGENQPLGTSIKIENKHDYHINFLSSILVHGAKAREFECSHGIFYHFKRTERDSNSFVEIIDKYRNKKKYLLSEDNSLDKIQKFTSKNGREYYCKSSKKLFWKKNDRESKLTGEVIFQGQTNQAQYAKAINYDNNHNLSSIVLCGNVHGGEKTLFPHSGKEALSCSNTNRKETKFFFDPLRHHLLKTQALPGGKTLSYEYFADTNLIAKVLLKNKNGHNIERAFYFYDKNYFLIREIKDDGKADSPDIKEGITFRFEKKIENYLSGPSLGLPKRITYLSSNTSKCESQIFRIEEYEYNLLCQVKEKRVYDNDLNLLFSIRNKYDRYGLLLANTDESGVITTYQYDKYRRKISQRNESTGFKEKFFYDDLDRLIRKETYESANLVFTQSFVYDYLNRCILEEDQYGNKIRYEYSDDKMEPSKIIKGNIPINPEQLQKNEFSFQYDLMGNKTKIIMPDGSCTLKAYTIDGHPCSEVDPNGNLTQKVYDIEGKLIQISETGGFQTTFSYDLNGNKIKESKVNSKGALISQLLHEYRGKLVTKTTNHLGISTLFQYDNQLRKIQETTCIGTTRKNNYFSYDPKGNLIEEINEIDPKIGQKIIKRYTYNKKNRVTEEIFCDEKHKSFKHLKYQYDCNGNIIKQSQVLESTSNDTYFQYDGLSRILYKIDPEGNITRYSYKILRNKYKQFIQEQTIYHSDGIIEQIQTNQNGSIVLKAKFNELHQEIAKEEIFYDFNERKTCQVTYIYINTNLSRINRVDYKYDANGNMTSLIESAENKKSITKYKYNNTNQLVEVIKPNLIKLEYLYNDTNLLQSLQSSDRTIFYDYKYDSFHRLVQVKDNIHNICSQYEYDQLGNIRLEKLANGVHIRRNYDPSQRVKNISFLNGEIEFSYRYTTFDLSSISRIRNGQCLYEFSYLEFDYQGRPLQQSLIGGLGSEKFSYDSVNRLCTKNSPHYEFSILKKDQLGNIIEDCSIVNEQSQSNVYLYDSFNQLSAEKGIRNYYYQYDSNYNLLKMNNIDLKYEEGNKVTSTSQYSFTYDMIGNIIKKYNKDVCYSFEYDALDRLTKIVFDDCEVHYIYDHQNRRMKRIERRNNKEQEENYLYDKQHEIGITNSSFVLNQLKVNAKGYSNEIGSAVAIEIKDQIYSPIINLYGDITGLLDLEGNVIEEYTFNAFGYSKNCFSDSFINPWRYKSKRHENEIELIHFLNRYYDPSIQRFISIDPLGYESIYNYYQFSMNNPLSILDIFGLTVAEMGTLDYFYDEMDPVTHLISYLLRPTWYYNPGESILYEENRAVKSQIGFYKGTNPIQNPHVAITHINGICTTMESFYGNLEYLSHLSGGMDVRGVYNSTAVQKYLAASSLFLDTRECVLGLVGIRTEPVQLLANLWNDTLEELGRTGIILHVPHSQGAIHTYNALQLMTQEQRDHIHILAIAPAKFIPVTLSEKSMNIVSKDFVPNLQKKWYPSLENINIIKLKPKDPHVKFDHDFKSQTYKEEISKFLIKEY